jgi:DNA repair exonuclease SbcCD ATPase subunit
MVIHKLRIKDIGPFHDTTYELKGAQVIGVLGPNATGKSTLLKVLRWLLTGSMGAGRVDKINSFYRQGAKGRAIAEIEFEANGTMCRLKKSFTAKTSTKVELQVGEDPVLTTVSEVEETVVQLLGADKHALAQAAFLPQGKLDELLFGTAGEREKLYIQLLDMFFCGTTSKYLKAKAGALIEDIDVLVRSQTAWKHTQEQQRTGLDALHKELNDIPDFSEAISSWKLRADMERKVEAAAEKRDALQQEQVVVQCEFDTVLSDVGADSVEQLIEQRTLLQQQKQQLEHTRDSFTEQRNTFTRYMHALEFVNRARGNEEIEKQALQMAEATPLPEPPAMTGSALAAASAAVRDVEKQLNEVKEWKLNRLEDREFTADARCDRCGSIYQPTDEDLDTMVEKFQASYDTLAAWYNPQETLRAVYDYELKQKEHRVFEQRNKLVSACSERAASEGVLEQYETVPENPGDCGDLTSNIRELSNRIDKLSDYVKALDPNELKLLSLGQQLEAVENEFQQSKKRLGQFADPESQFPIEEMEAQHERRTEFVGRVRQSQLQLDETDQRMKDMDAQLEKAKLRIKVSSELNKASDLMSFDFIPHQYVSYKFERLIEPTQQILQELNADFSIANDPENELSLVFEQFKGDQIVELPMHKLSGGQRVRLAVSFLLAVQRDLVRDAGFMTLDEPSTHLDDDGKTALANMLRSIPQILGAGGSQVWVVDHCPELEMSFDKVIKLEKQI